MFWAMLANPLGVGLAQLGVLWVNKRWLSHLFIPHSRKFKTWKEEGREEAPTRPFRPRAKIAKKIDKNFFKNYFLPIQGFLVKWRGSWNKKNSHSCKYKSWQSEKSRKEVRIHSFSFVYMLWMFVHVVVCKNGWNSWRKGIWYVSVHVYICVGVMFQLFCLVFGCYGCEWYVENGSWMNLERM